MSNDNNKNYRSNFTKSTTRWAVRRAQWLAMGIPEEDFNKPKIAIVNTSSQLSICYSHLDDISKQVQASVREAGGLPFEIRTAAPSDFITSAGRQGRYLMPTRDLVVNDIEVQVEGAVLDGIIFLSSCDKTTPAHLMAAGRLNLPSVVVPCGYQLGGCCGGKQVDIETVYCSVGSVKAKIISEEELSEITRHAINGPGVCAGLATANSMHVLAEALGMAQTGSTPIRAASERQYDFARRAGGLVLKLIEDDVRPRDILVKAAFENAVKVAVSIGTSVNVIRHLAAVAAETQCDVDILDVLQETQSQFSQIAQVRPNGPTRIEEFDEAGGTSGVMKQLQERLDLTVHTIEGRNLGQNLSLTDMPDESVIRPLSNPFKSEPGLAIFKGSLAPVGAIVKISAFPADINYFKGSANVFEDEYDAIDALENGDIKDGDVVVLRMLGPKGGPGTVFAAGFMAALVGSGKGSTVAVVTDGELSGLNSGITIGQVMPEAAEKGPLAYVENGDVIVIDLKDYSINWEISEDEKQFRYKNKQIVLPDSPQGWLSQYRSLVQPISKGAYLWAPTEDQAKE